MDWVLLPKVPILMPCVWVIVVIVALCGGCSVEPIAVPSEDGEAGRDASKGPDSMTALSCPDDCVNPMSGNGSPVPCVCPADCPPELPVCCFEPILGPPTGYNGGCYASTAEATLVRSCLSPGMDVCHPIYCGGTLPACPPARPRCCLVGPLNFEVWGICEQEGRC